VADSLRWIFFSSPISEGSAFSESRPREHPVFLSGEKAQFDLRGGWILLFFSYLLIMEPRVYLGGGREPADGLEESPSLVLDGADL